MSNWVKVHHLNHILVLKVIQFIDEARPSVVNVFKYTCVWRVRFLVNQYPGYKLHNEDKRTL